MKANIIDLGGWQKANADQIVLLEADINYTQVYFANGSKMLVATTLGKIEKRLAEQQDFFRPNRGYVVNLNYVAMVDTEKATVSLKIKNGLKIGVSRRRIEAFRAWAHQVC
jgi:DNA-binding LytR/AlgR family response regulator